MTAQEIADEAYAKIREGLKSHDNPPTQVLSSMTTVSVTGLDKALAHVRNAPKQVAFASVQAVNETGKLIQQDTLTSLLPSKFVLRSKGAPWQRPGTRHGFNLRFANKTMPEPTAVIGSRADWLALQEEGGTKQKATTVAIPTLFWKSRQEILAKNKRPKAIARLLHRTRAGRRLTKAQRATLGSSLQTPFYIKGYTAGSGHAFPSGWWVRTSSARLPIRPLFFFYQVTKIPPVLQFIGTESKLASAELFKQFERALAKAVATAK